MRRTRTLAMIGLLMSFVLLIAGVSAATPPATKFTSPFQNTPSSDIDLVAAVEQATIQFLGNTPSTKLVVSNLNTISPWAFGTVAVPAPVDEEARPIGLLYLAQKKQLNWEVALESTPQFVEWVRQVPEALMGAETQAVFAQGSGMGDGSADLSLPWATGETWSLTGGPHGSTREALDFAGGSGNIRAAREGVAYRPCANQIIIYHPTGGWRTGYYHVANIAVANGQSVARGQYLGTISTGVGCGGSATGSHVHFWLQLNATNQAMNNRDIGGWNVQQAASNYYGCMVRISDGLRRCADTRTGSSYTDNKIYNDGKIGSGENQRPNVPNQISPGNGSTVNGRTVTLSWQDTGDPDNRPNNYRDFYVEVKDAGGGIAAVLPWTRNTSWSREFGEGTYTWHVKSGDGATESSWSPDWRFTVACDVLPVGEGSSRKQAFVDAFNRRGGRNTYGCTVNGAHWWGDGGDRTVVIQDLQGGPAGNTAIIHDEKRDIPANSTPAYIVQGGIWGYYVGLGGWESWLGPPTSDEFENATGQAQSNFRRGYINYNGGNPKTEAWPAPNGQWHVEYHNGRNLNNYPTWVQNEAEINHNWGDAAPGGGRWGVWADNFSARWTRRFNFDAGDYTFISNSDDGVRVWVDNNLIIDHWQEQALVEYRSTVSLPSGAHDVKVEYFENAGGAIMQFRWEKVNLPPAKPSNLSTPSRTETSITLAWQDNSTNEDGFRVYRWRGEDGTWPLVGTVGPGVTQLTDTSVSCGVGYTYYVTAYNSSGSSDGTDWLAASTLACPASPTVTPTATTPTATSTTLPTTTPTATSIPTATSTTVPTATSIPTATSTTVPTMTPTTTATTTPRPEHMIYIPLAIR